VNIYIDIETLPADWSDAQIEAHARQNVPGNYSKPETIEKWITDNADELHRRTALDGMHARLLCVGLAVGDDEPVDIIYSETVDIHELCDQLFDHLENVLHPVFIGHNVAGFDLPMLRRFAWRAGHKRLARLFPSRPRSPQVIDTLDLWKGTDAHGKGIRLAQLAEFFGYPGKKEDLDGSQVYDAFLRGEHERIARYCAGDVELVRNLVDAML